VRRLLCLAAALAVLGVCGAQAAPEEPTTQSTEAPSTTQVIEPKLSREDAEKIVEDFIGERAHLLRIHAYTMTEDGQYYVVQASCYWEADEAIFNGNYCVDVITDELFGPNEARGDVIGASLPLKNLKYLNQTAEECHAAEAAVKSLLPEQFCGIFRFVQREGKKCCIYWVADMTGQKYDYVYCDLATNELFLWNLENDTLMPYSPA
jgi:hypothetical protein